MGTHIQSRRFQTQITKTQLSIQICPVCLLLAQIKFECYNSRGTNHNLSFNFECRSKQT